MIALFDSDTRATRRQLSKIDSVLKTGERVQAKIDGLRAQEAQAKVTAESAIAKLEAEKEVITERQLDAAADGKPADPRDQQRLEAIYAAIDKLRETHDKAVADFTRQRKRLATEMPHDYGRLSGERTNIINRFCRGGDENRLKVIDRFLHEARQGPLMIWQRKVDDARIALRLATNDAQRRAAREAVEFTEGVCGCFAAGIQLAEQERDAIFSERKRALGI